MKPRKSLHIPDGPRLHGTKIKIDVAKESRIGHRKQSLLENDGFYEDYLANGKFILEVETSI